MSTPPPAKPAVKTAPAASASVNDTPSSWVDIICSSWCDEFFKSHPNIASFKSVIILYLLIFVFVAIYLVFVNLKRRLESKETSEPTNTEEENHHEKHHVEEHTDSEVVEEKRTRKRTVAPKSPRSAKKAAVRPAEPAVIDLVASPTRRRRQSTSVTSPSKAAPISPRGSRRTARK